MVLNFRLCPLREMHFSSTDDDLRDAMAWHTPMPWRGAAAHRFKDRPKQTLPRLASSRSRLGISLLGDFPGDSP